MPTSSLEFWTLPSAIITDGFPLNTVPLFAVSRMTLSETYSLPTIGSSKFRAVVANSEDTVTLSALLPGPSRFAWKQVLEMLADFSRRGGALGRWTGGTFGGLILVTSMTVRMDMQITSLSFTASAQRRECLEVSISMTHVPRPGALNFLIDVAHAAVMSLADFGRNKAKED